MENNEADRIIFLVGFCFACTILINDFIYCLFYA